MDNEKLQSMLTDQILNLAYNIMTDSLALNTTSGVEDQTEVEKAQLAKRNNMKWNDMFTKIYKDLKVLFKKNANEPMKDTSMTQNSMEAL